MSSLNNRNIRSNSLTKAGIENIPSTVQQSSSSQSSSQSSSPILTNSSKLLNSELLTKKLLITPATFLQDIKSFRWMTNPLTSFKMISIIISLWIYFELIPTTAFYSFDSPNSNPLNPLLFISYPLPSTPASLLAGESQRWDKGMLDFYFLGFYIIVFSFLRQALTEFTLRPLAKALGLKTNAKQLRFMEQAYAVIYNLISGSVGLWIMYNGDTWWYQTEHFWLQFPHWRMTTVMKSYYLLQTAYWLQQMIVLSLRLEKPRSDYYQLIVHHVVTIWLVGWSYTTSLNMIGVAIFVSMDIPEIFLGLSKCLNYIDAQRASEIAFVCLLGFWTYMRHYLNLKILYSVWYEFELIPLAARSWSTTSTSFWSNWILTGLGRGTLPDWIRYQIFLPIFLLQLVNGFWSFLLWRILFRLIVGIELRDDREDGDEDEEEDTLIENGNGKVNGRKIMNGNGNGHSNGNGNGNGNVTKEKKRR